MTESLVDGALCAKGLALLEDQLDPVETLRFLALLSRQPFDYQLWRQQHFVGMSLAEVLTQAQGASPQSQRKKPSQEGNGKADAPFP
ncbi:MAG: hypothetical protein OEU26_14145 [Candidatus Tectomicrobia bacterium]|nr:hypothetical protein [Candidatus Tectomicrobia bacterium]